MKLKTFEPILGLAGDDFARDRRSFQIYYRTGRQKVTRVYTYTFPMDVLRDIGAKELAQRIYWVFKQKIKNAKI